MVRKTIKILLCGFMLFGGIRCTEDGSFPEEKKLTLTQSLRLGTDSLDVPDHRNFSFVTEVVTDHEGRLYVVDAKESKIRVYAKTGTFIRYIGKQGAGPGEFQNISALFIDQQNRLIAADPGQGRVTLFSLKGELLSTHKLPVPDVEQISEMPGGRYVLVGYREERLVHVVDANFKVVASLVPVTDILHTENRLEKMWVQYDPGRVLISAQDSILFVPRIYAGALYKYTLVNEEDWQFSGTVRGYNRHKNPVTFSSYEQAERVDVPFTLPRGRFAAQLHSSSHGLYWNNKDTFMHFSVQERESGKRLDLIGEQFSPEGRLLYYAVIDSMQRPNILVHGMQNGFLYLYDNKDTPLLRRLKIESDE